MGRFWGAAHWVRTECAQRKYRAYYAVFNAANALLSTKEITRSKHSGVIAAFRQYFVKTGEIEGEYSHVFGQLLDDRNVSDYVILEEIEAAQAFLDVSDAKRFVERVEAYLQSGGWR
ncbi:MAG: HEPN domain-containing protein [Chloroflexota bacterium]|nr:HEPN domain-containing protein [Chloroflexota bacterium]